MIKRYCDSCGKEICDGSYVCPVDLSIGYRHTIHRELCEKCAESLLPGCTKDDGRKRYEVDCNLKSITKVMEIICEVLKREVDNDTKK
jgi:hypothetical protein